MSNMRWSEKETYCFVKLYLAQETLWNPKLPTYKSKPERHKAYIKIMSDFKRTTGISMSEPEVTTKIKNLRSTYAQELCKIRRRSSADSVYKPSIKWFPAWHKCFSTRFIRRDFNSDDSMFNQAEPVDESCQKIWVSSEANDDENDNSNSDPFESEQDNFLLVLKPEPEDIKPEDPPRSYKIKKKKFKHRTSTDNSDRSYRNSIDNDTAKDDEFDIYGKYIASQLRKMDLQKALRLQLEIQSLVSEARISDIAG